MLSWGLNDDGQLGTGTIAEQHTPVMISLPCTETCAPADSCHAASACAATGFCTSVPVADGTACENGRSCVSGACVPSVSIRKDCAGASEILETIPAASCVNFSAATISAGASFATLHGVGTYTLYEGPNCTGGKRQTSANTYFCGYYYDNGHELNDHAMSISFP